MREAAAMRLGKLVIVFAIQVLRSLLARGIVGTVAGAVFDAVAGLGVELAADVAVGVFVSDLRTASPVVGGVKCKRSVVLVWRRGTAEDDACC